jgi:NAD(P)-dependent dehydrogenase (short-subunit alcohol dehydrogenase family)
MIKLGFTGASSVIAKKYQQNWAPSGCGYFQARNASDLPLDLDEYIICQGVLWGNKLSDTTLLQAEETFFVNFTDIARFCDKLFDVNDRAKVCVVGSMSGEQGSYDMSYAGSKAALHLYVRQKKLTHAEQHLVCVAPWIIADAKMTTEREDLAQVHKRGRQRRLGRWASASEVARIMHFALHEPLLCNTVIEAKGGNC